MYEEDCETAVERHFLLRPVVWDYIRVKGALIGQLNGVYTRVDRKVDVFYNPSQNIAVYKPGRWWQLAHFDSKMQADKVYYTNQSPAKYPPPKGWCRFGSLSDPIVFSCTPDAIEIERVDGPKRAR